MFVLNETHFTTQGQTLLCVVCDDRERPEDFFLWQKLTKRQLSCRKLDLTCDFLAGYTRN